MALPAGISGASTTYMHDGTQYVAVALSARDHEGELIAFPVR